jgi:hypothetical protein
MLLYILYTNTSKNGASPEQELHFARRLLIISVMKTYAQMINDNLQYLKMLLVIGPLNVQRRYIPDHAAPVPLLAQL